MNTVTTAYIIKRVREFMNKISPEKTYRVEKLPKPEIREQLVSVTKKYIYRYPWQGHITFNHDYSISYKLVTLPE